MKHLISSVSGNNITLTSALNYTVKNNVRVTRLSRNILFECLTPATDFAHLYVEHTSSWNRACIIKDAYFRNWGNGDTNTRTGICIRGLNSYDDDNIDVTLTETIPSRKTGTWLEGINTPYYPEIMLTKETGEVLSGYMMQVSSL